jgi:hypothetical protein
MKHLILVLLMATFAFQTVQAAETETECEFMKESTQRDNPKANLQSAKPRQVRSKGATAQ